MNTQQAIAQFTTDPKNFLKSNCVIIAGGTTRAPGMTIFRMTPGSTKVMKAGVFGMNPRPMWSVNISNNNGGNPAPGVVLAPDEFEAYYIPMKQQNDPAANTFGNPPSDGTVTLMLTSQLTGCTFGFSNIGGNFVASHLQPQAGVPQATNRQQMANLIQAGMSGSGTLAQKGTDYRDLATIVGVFRHGQWKVYMQPIDFNPGDGTNGFKEIMGIVKL